MGKVLLWLLLLAIAGRVAHVLLVGFSSTYMAWATSLRHEFGNALFVFAVGAIGAGIAAFAQRKKGEPDAGLTTGLVLVLMMTAWLMYSQVEVARLAARGLLR